MRHGILLLLSLTPLFAVEKKYNFRTDFSLGRYVDGPRLTPALQKDKATLLLFWAYELDGPSGGEDLKAFQKLADEHKEDMLVIGVENVGATGTAKNITTLTKKAGLTFSMYSGCRAPFKTNTYPYVCVFDREGKLLYNAVPKSEPLLEAIAQAVAKPEKKDGKNDPKKNDNGKPKVDPKKSA
jgi:hypothetical protein